MNQKLTIYQRLNRVLSGDSASQVKNYVIDRDVLKDLDPAAYQKEKLEAQQTLYLSNQWKRVDNELYQRAVFYEPTRIAAYFDYESMEFCLHGDTQIVTPSGSMSIKELSDLGRDHEFIVYAYDHNIKKVVPALARNAHHTRNEMTYKVTFDDGTFIIATYDHQFMKRDGSFERVRNLKPGDSMMPFYRKSFYNNENYNWVYTCNSNDGHNGWVAEHNLIAEWFYDKKLNENEVVHHKDFIGKNNSPENLVIMDKSEHQSYHCQLNNQKLWQDPHYCTKMCEVAKRLGKYSWNGKRSGKNNPAYFTIPFDNIIEIAKQIKTLKGTANALGISHTKLQREIMWAGYKDWCVFCEAYGIERSKYSTARVKNESYALNHKIASIEEYGVEPVYDLTVPGYKNFATDTIFSHNTPEISAALDIFMEEATTPDEKGNVLTIYSDDVRIKQELETLFYDILDVNTNLAPWIRNTCKYGDNFIAHKIIPEKGIIGVTQLPNIEITRTESMYPKAVGLDMANNDKENIRFYWKNKDLEFNGFEVSHFRLLGDDRRLPYGTSILEKGRRIWKQLMLAEDAMLVYRITRAPERRVYKVFVGNMDDKDVDAYVDKIANTFKRSNVVNSENGTSDLRYNQLSVDQDFFVPIRDVSQTNPIETLPGAQNLSEIADIEYIQQKLFAALRIPKAFLGFSDPIGEGKNLAILDVRFARAVNRIQKAMIQELNKIAIIHLYVRGFVDDLTNFRLSMTSPSTQADILKLERWSQKITLYRDAVIDAGNGFGAMSMTLAKKTLLEMSDDEVKLDIQQQAVEKAAGEELKVLSEVIKQTGVFNDLYKIYNIDPNNLNIGPKGTGEGETDMPLGGGGVGGAVPFGAPFGAPEAEQGEESGFDTLQSGGIGGTSNEEPPKEEGGEQKPNEEGEEKDNLSENVRHLAPFQNRPKKTLSEINQERISAKMLDIIKHIEKLEKKK